MIGYEICPFFIITSSLFSNDLMALLSLVCVCVFPGPTPVLHPPKEHWPPLLLLSWELWDVAGAWRWRTSMSWEEVEVLGGGRCLRKGWRWAGGAHTQHVRG